MKIAMVGTGYVGLVSGTCFAEFGHNVTCIDNNPDKIACLESGDIPIYEPGLKSLVRKQTQAGRLTFTTDLAAAVHTVEAVFIAVGTPPHPTTGHADMQYVHAAAKEIAHAITGYTVIVTKSTVPVGTAADLTRIIKEECPDAEFDICSNPEFLREGSAINDFMTPDRVVIGTPSNRATTIMKTLYRPLQMNQTPIMITTPETSETIKYASNAFLATKITFINEIANLCEKTGADAQHVARGIGLDKRIGSKFLQAGPGYGGSCFPKDTMALQHMGQQYGARQRIVENVVTINHNRQHEMADRIISACGGSVSGKTLAVLGIAFKSGTDDIRDAPSLTIIPQLQKSGATIKAFDPAAMKNAQDILHTVTWCKNSYEAAQDADALIILTEWNEFRALDLSRIEAHLKHPLIIDLRNLYKLEDMNAQNFTYISIGRPSVHPASKGQNPHTP